MNDALLRLIQAGVAASAAAGLAQAAASDSRNALVIVPLPGEPRPGDRLRPKGPRTDGSTPPTLRVIAAAPAGARWAIVGEPVDAGTADDFMLPPGLG